MAKDAYYFPHDSNARNDQKILELLSVYGMEGYGRYWVIVEMLRDSDAYRLKYNKYTPDALAMQMQCDRNAAHKFLDDCIKEFELFQTDGEYFWSNSLCRRMEKFDAKSTQARVAAEARWGKKNADAMLTQCGRTCRRNASKVKESKVNKSTVQSTVSARKTGTDPRIKEILTEIQAFLGYSDKTGVDPIPNYGMEGKHVKRMLARGFEPEEILKCWKQKISQRGEFVSAHWVNQDIRKGGTDGPAGRRAEDYTRPEDIL